MQNKIDMGNGLPVWSERDIEKRLYIEKDFAIMFKEVFHSVRPNREMIRIETSPLIHTNFLKHKGTFTAHPDCVKTSIDAVVLRNETTLGSYMAAEHFMSNKVKIPFCVWQSGMSFRDEDMYRDANHRYRAFHQLEFQVFCLKPIDNEVDSIFMPMVHQLEARIKYACIKEVKKEDRPSYSLDTLDLEIGGVEIASMSRRHDFPILQAGSERKIEVLEFAFGSDRLVKLL